MTTSTVFPSSVRAPVTGAVLSAVFAILLGGFFIFGVGFAGPLAIHNAPPHGGPAFAFPCPGGQADAATDPPDRTCRRPAVRPRRLRPSAGAGGPADPTGRDL